jgi:hypothetical protein
VPLVGMGETGFSGITGSGSEPSGEDLHFTIPAFQHECSVRSLPVRAVLSFRAQDDTAVYASTFILHEWGEFVNYFLAIL